MKKKGKEYTIYGRAIDGCTNYGRSVNYLKADVLLSINMKVAKILLAF